ncbi:LysR family transcriptional regulator [Ferrimonas balearica]|uniref:LysR family transcriptional regulator n=1 Tax=Ferrimonas balearica TaxID=44012 RepID=UPI001C99B071|nr:LysR family transcriptional regulator [Ferrimonas balearica]MBY5920263.1 LysR family transcriptional regulator [Ferrimonas balearica]MBY5997052.1 LysR family transcriptional regulator [Ferrimonas balearica]
MKDIRDLDLNLLKLLQVVVETRNTHAAAERLGISQTSVSRGITKLKEVFGDQLFVRKAHGVEPSELALKLAEAADEMYRPLSKVIESYQGFNPKEFGGEITVCMHIYFLELYGAGIFEALKRALPRASFNLSVWQPHSLTDMLNGKIDYLIHFDGFKFPQDIYLNALIDIDICLVARKAHPVLSHSSNLEDIHHLPLARITIDGINTKRTPIEAFYQSRGYQAHYTLVTHSVHVLLALLKQSDAILYGSRTMKQLSDEVATYPLPQLPNEMRKVQVNGGYLQTKRDYPLNQLIHETIQRYFDDVVQPEQPPGETG